MIAQFSSANLWRTKEKAIGFDDVLRSVEAMKGISGKRLMYKGAN